MNPHLEFLVNIAVKEYELLRSEMMSTVERQYSLVNWGTSSAVLIVAGLVAGWSAVQSIPAVISIVILLVIPTMVTVFVAAWSHVITKLNMLGSRLYDIEEHLAKAIDAEHLRQVYMIPASDILNPCEYLIGWEHRLWRGGVNSRVQTTIRVVRFALFAVYAALVLVNYVFLIGHLEQYLSVSISVVVFCLWCGVGGIVFRYLRKHIRD
ncbi:MAG TPA: hypothetical protein VMN36_15005 [Verrucomicrobiales bacterium]|nr:hypothetical protein [Verrucomicrobiales bacterium]